MDIPPEASVAVIQGPWFFLGIQTLLKLLPVFLAGLIIPGVFVGCLLILPVIRTDSSARDHRGRIAYVGGNCLHYLLVIALCVYGLLTLRAAIWGP